MKVLFLADIHGDMNAVTKAGEFIANERINCVFLLGDYSAGFKDPEQNKRDASFTLDVMTKRAEVYALPGNCDQKETLSIFDEYGVNAHERVVVLDGVSFVCLGGSNPTPFNTPFEFPEEEIYSKLVSLLRDVTPSNTVLATHFSPKDTVCDKIPSGLHVGSSSLRRVIEEYKPKAVVCSHIHECGGVGGTLSGTRLANVGVLSGGNAVLFETKDFKLTFLKIE